MTCDFVILIICFNIVRALGVIDIAALRGIIIFFLFFLVEVVVVDVVLFSFCCGCSSCFSFH
jgi:hypothetical protein